jgi:quinol monooxygenase YgiN
MSLIVHYTLSSPAGHDAQVAAMRELVAGFRAEGVKGVHYSAYATEAPERFVGILDFADEAGRQAFLASAAFAAYRARVGPTFANPPQTTTVTAIASTRG